MSKRRSRWPVWIALAALAACSGPAQDESRVAGDDTVASVEFPATAADEVTPSEQEPGAGDAPAEETLSAGINTEAELDARMQAAFADGSHEALHDALALLLELRHSRRAELNIGALDMEAWGRRVATALIEWGTLGMEHQSLELAAQDLPLLERWDDGDPRLSALSGRLAHLRAVRLRLDEADRLIAVGRLVGDGPDSAVSTLRALLRDEPTLFAARQRLASIERRLLDTALAAAHDGRFDEADSALADAAQVLDDSARVAVATVEVRAIREKHIEQQKADIFAALAVGDVDAAEGLLPVLDAIALDDRDGALMRKEIERVRRYGAYDAGALFADPLPSGVLGPGMVVVPVGEFMMGSARSERGHQPNEAARHAVRFVRGFALARTETTVAQFRAFIEATGYRTTAEAKRRSMVYDERSGALVERRRASWKDDYSGKPAVDDSPVLHVSFADAQAYADWLAEQTGLPYRLPSEAEFEYALRAGSTSVYPWGEGSPAEVVENLTGAHDESPTRRRWSNAFADYGDGYWGPAPVGRFASNPFGLNDMNGNVSEWVADCWHDNYARAPRDGSAWVNPGCPQQVIRGASWASSPEQARSAYRTSASGDTVSARVGFRVARDL